MIYFSYRRFSARCLPRSSLLFSNLAPFPCVFRALFHSHELPSQSTINWTNNNQALSFKFGLIYSISSLKFLLVHCVDMSLLSNTRNIIRRSEAMIVTLSSRFCNKSVIFSKQQSRSYSIPIDSSNCSQVSNCMVNSIFCNFSLPSWGEFIWLIKRTFQPSVLRKRRKTGFLSRHKSTGGRKILKRRIEKGRARLGGC